MPLHPVNNERELLEKVANGDEYAFANLFYSYHNQLGEFVFLLTASHELTEEIIQDVFLKIWKMRAALPTVNHFTGWLFILARNYTLNCLRKKTSEFKKRVEYERHVLEADTDESNESTNAYSTLIKKAIAQLPNRQKMAISLRHFEGLSYAAIAEIMNISKDSVKKYRQLALRSLVKYIKSNISSVSEMLFWAYFFYDFFFETYIPFFFFPVSL